MIKQTEAEKQLESLSKEELLKEYLKIEN